MPITHWIVTKMGMKLISFTHLGNCTEDRMSEGIYCEFRYDRLCPVHNPITSNGKPPSWAICSRI